MPVGFRGLFGNGIGGGLQPVPPPPLLRWALGALWQISVICAKQGSYGLQRSANGITGSSDTTSTAPFTVTAGQTLFTSFFVKASVGANGVIGFGYAFYNAASVLLSTSFISTTSFSTDWTQVVGNITVPNFAVTAVPIVRATDHTSGFWCIDSVLSSKSGGSWKLSSIKHYFSDFVSYR
jgi:hypothetical protein